MAAPGLSLSWPVVTTCSPGLTPVHDDNAVLPRLARPHEAPLGDELRLALGRAVSRLVRCDAAAGAAFTA